MSRLLLVDDEPDIAPLVAMCLDHLDVQVINASGLEEALLVARAAPVDLVLLDLALGNADGLEILPRLRAEPGLEKVPIVAFTAHDSRRAEALERGVDSFVRRPFAPVELQAAVRPYLRTRGSASASS